jgi:hypothetical protein
MTQKNCFLLIALAAVAISCAHEKIEYGENRPVASSEKNAKGLRGEITWFKNAENKLEMGVVLTNQYDHPIFFRETSLKLKTEQGLAALKKSNYTRVFELGRGDRHEMMVAFLLPQGEFKEGPATLEISKIRAGEINEPGRELPPLEVEVELTEEE